MALILVSVSFFVFAALSAVSAQVDNNEPPATTIEEITTADLGVENSGLLPTNLFYFFKEWGRGIKMFFTFNNVAKIRYELKIANEKAAELKKVDEVKPNDAEALEKALNNYNENVLRLKTRLQSLQENSDNSNVDKLLDELAERTLKHQQLFEELKERHEDLREKLDDVEKGIGEVLKHAIENLDKLEKTEERLEKAIDAQKENQIKELNAIHFLNMIKENVNSPEIIEKLSQLKEKQMDKLEAKLKSGVINSSQIGGLIEKLNGSGVEASEILKKLEEGLDNVNGKLDVKNQLDKLKQKILDESEVEPQACMELYDPVCGADAKTYSNSCFAGIAHVEVKYKGECGKQGSGNSDSLKFEVNSQINISPDSIKVETED